MCIISDLQHGPAILLPFSDPRTLSFFKELSNSFCLAALWLTVPLLQQRTLCSPSKAKRSQPLDGNSFLFLLPKIKLTHITLSFTEVSLQLGSIRSPVLCRSHCLLPPRWLSLTTSCLSHIFTLSSEPSFFTSLSHSQVSPVQTYTHLLWLHISHDFLPSLAPLLQSHTSWARSLSCFWAPCLSLLLYVPFWSSQGRHDSFNATFTTFIFPLSQHNYIKYIKQHYIDRIVNCKQLRNYCSQMTDLNSVLGTQFLV